MTRLRNLVLLIVVLALVASGCSGDTGVGAAPAATVNGVEISDADLIADLRTFNENSEFASQLVGVMVHADGDPAADRVDATFAAAFLELTIILEILDQEFDARGLEVTQADRDAVTSQFDQALLDQLDSLPDDVEEWFVDWNARIIVLRDHLAEGLDSEVTDDAVRSYYDDNIAQYENQVCAQHILLETEDEADDVLAELEAGADFATLAEERSIDPSAATNGGDLGCTSADRYVEEFADAVTEGEVGEHLGPVETDFGFHVILVTSRGTTAFEDAEAGIRSQLEQEAAGAPAQAFSELLEELVAAADVTVSSRYGSWDDENGRVVAPEGPADARLSIG